MQPLTFKAQYSLPHTQVGLILAGNSNKGTQRTLWLEECSVASPLMSPCWHGLCGKAVGTQEPPTCGMWVPHLDVGYTLDMITTKGKSCWVWGSKWRCTFTERTALSGDLDRVLAALFAGHGRAVRLSIHALAEGAVVLLPLLLVCSQLIIHPATRLGAVHWQQLHIWEERQGFGWGRGEFRIWFFAKSHSLVWLPWREFKPKAKVQWVSYFILKPQSQNRAQGWRIAN